MQAIFATILVCLHIISIKCRVYDIRDEHDFDYVKTIDKRLFLSSPLTQNHERTRRSSVPRKFQEEGDEHFRSKKNLNFTSYVFENDANNFAFVFWKSAHTDVIFILTCNNASTQTHSKRTNKGCHSQSNFYRSDNLGATYKRGDVEETQFEGRQLHSIYLSPLNKTVIIITDYKTKTIFLTHDEGRTYTKISPGFSPTFILFHPKNPQTIAAFDNFKKTLWVTLDGGVTWMNVMNSVRNYFWDEMNIDSLYIEKDYSVQYSELCHVNVYHLGIPEYKATRFTVKKIKQHLVKDSVYVGGGFLLVQQASDLELYVAKITTTHVGSHIDNLRFIKPIYSLNKKRHVHQVVLSSDNNELVLGILNPDETVTLYLSDELGKSFRHLIGNVVTEKFEESEKSKIPKIDFYVAKGTKNTYIVNLAKNATHISFDKGHNWRTLNFTKTDIHGKDINCWPMECLLNLYIKVEKQYMYYSAPMLSKDSAPGIIMAQGSIRRKVAQYPINNEHNVWISTDGGRSWRMTLERNHGFAFLDHGNFLAATPLTFNVKHNIHFSDNFGKSWLTTQFAGYQSRIAAIITDSTAKTLIINVFGFLYRDQQASRSSLIGDTWIVWRFNFTDLFNRVCKESDYIKYSASAESCVLGEKISYWRNKRHPNLTSTCYSPAGRNTSYVVSVPCQCKKVDDFECDDFYKYTQGKNDFTCEPINKNYMAICDSDGYWNKPSGYRRLHGNKCIDGDEPILRSRKEKCTGTVPTEIKIRASETSVSVGDTIEFEMMKHSGSYLTTYEWSFGDNRAVNGSYEEMKNVKHVYYTQRQYIVQLIARNNGRSYTTSLIVIVVDKTYYNSFIDYNDPAIVGEQVTFTIQTLQPDSSRKLIPKQHGMKFIWSFRGVFQGGTGSSEIRSVFHKSGTYTIEVQIITPTNIQTMYRMIQVFEDAYVIDFEFSNKLDFFNTETSTWMVDFMYKFKMFLAIKYEIHDMNRLLIKGEPKKPTTVRAIICDMAEHVKAKRAIAIAEKIIKNVNENQPFLYGYEKAGIHVTKARKVGFLERKQSEPANVNKESSSSKGWVYVLVVIIIIVAVGGIVYNYRYRHSRRCFFIPYAKNDIMQKKLVFDVDDDCVEEISDLPQDRHEL